MSENVKNITMEALVRNALGKGFTTTRDVQNADRAISQAEITKEEDKTKE